MNDEEKNRQYRAMADAFIDVANEYAKDTDKQSVGSAFLYGASRFCAFLVAAHSQELSEYEENRESAAEYFRDEFQRMLNENLDNYREAFGEQLKYGHLMKKEE